MRSRAVFLVSAVVLATLLFPAVGCRNPAGSGGGGKEGQAPAFSLTSLSGEKVSLSDFKGKVVVLDFWATWCPPCRQLIPNLIALHQKYSEKGVVVVGIALDREGARVVEPFTTQAKIPYPVVLGDMRVTEAYGRVESIPTLFIIDRQGRVVRKLVGYHTYEELESQVSRYL